MEINDSDFSVESTNALFGLPPSAKCMTQHLLDDCDLGNADRLSPISIPQDVLDRRTARLQGKASGEWDSDGFNWDIHNSDKECEGDALLPSEPSAGPEGGDPGGAAGDDGADCVEDEDAAPFRSLEELIADAEARSSFAAAAPRSVPRPMPGGAAHATAAVPMLGTGSGEAPPPPSLVPTAAMTAAGRRETGAAGGGEEIDELRRQVVALRGTIHALQNRLEGVCAMTAVGSGQGRQPRVVDLSAAGLTGVYPFSHQMTVATGNQLGEVMEDVPQEGASASSSTWARKLPNNRVVRRADAQQSGRPSRGGGGGLLTRREHYQQEVQAFYEAVFQVSADMSAKKLSSGVVAVPGSITGGADPVAFSVSRQLLYEKLRHMDVMLSKFHGFEEDLFRLLRAKYNTPLYRFEHF
jgi:hypothetical protein